MSNTFGIDDADLQKQLEGLEQGKSMEIGGVTYINPAAPVPNCTRHYFEDAGMESETTQAVKCKNCINGLLIDTTTHTLRNGEIVRL